MENKKLPIPIKNIFYMLCYAWNVLSIKNDIMVGTDNFDDAYNLLARIFAHGNAKLIKSGFHRSYIEQNDDLGTVRGKINLKENFKNMLTRNGLCNCNYDEYSTNDVFNRIIKYTMNSLIRNKFVNKETKQTLKKQLLFFADIEESAPTKENMSKIVFNRNNTIYRLLINVALMIHENTIVNEESGKNAFKDFFREEQMQKVFELFILNFYDVNLDKTTYKVHAPKINWHIEENAKDTWDGIFDVATTLTDRRTDIVVENKKLKTQFIMDAKYYQKTFVEAYMSPTDERVRTTHLNQIRGYIIDSEYEGEKFGALLYPMTNNDIKKGTIFPIQGSNVIVKTLNLNDDWSEIEKDLIEFVHKVERRRV
jgi:5-methylcytosine-specific restriction enzyme subunit McrC